VPGPTDRELVVKAFDACLWPAGKPTLEDAWLGIYQVLWWYEHGFLHVREANDLLKRPWQTKATQAERYIAGAIGIPPAQLRNEVDRMMQLPRWRKAGGDAMQRNNPLGHGLRMLLSEVLTRWGDQRFEYAEEVETKKHFPGISMPGRSERPKVDVLARVNGTGRPRAVMSCKWSIRHDRISDPTNECTSYKAAAIQQQIMDLKYLVVTNELDGQRLDKILNQPCVDTLVLVRLELAQALNSGGTPMMIAARGATRLLDLTELVKSTLIW
jgi:hypothetical protein